MTGQKSGVYRHHRDVSNTGRRVSGNVHLQACPGGNGAILIHGEGRMKVLGIGGRNRLRNDGGAVSVAASYTDKETEQEGSQLALTHQSHRHPTTNVHEVQGFMANW